MEQWPADLSPEAMDQWVEDHFEGTLMGLLGMKVIEVSKERAVVELPVRTGLTTPSGHIHAGSMVSLADTSDFGVLRLIVNNNDKAKAVLKEHGFTVGKTHVVAVEVEDRPGGLNRILEILSKKSINVEYMYAFVQHTGEDAVIIFRFDDIDAAVKLLLDSNIKVLEGRTVYTL